MAGRRVFGVPEQLNGIQEVRSSTLLTSTSKNPGESGVLFVSPMQLAVLETVRLVGFGSEPGVLLPSYQNAVGQVSKSLLAVEKNRSSSSKKCG